MRVLALDYGSARCGTALSDPTGTIASPLEIVERPGTRNGLGALAEMVAAHGVERVVVGLPLSLRGGDSEQTRRTRGFAAKLQHVLGEGVPVELYDERFTTRMAQRLARGPNGSSRAGAAEDSLAAAHLLESWLQARAE
jgi:putative Holliday junction resolvase